MVENPIDLIVRVVHRLIRPLVMLIDWLHEDFTLWTLMRNPSGEPPGVLVGSRADQMARYFRLSPEPMIKREACLTGWAAVLMVVASAVLFAVRVPEFAWLLLMGGVLAWLFALEQTVGYEVDYHRSRPKPYPDDIDGFLETSLAEAVANALGGTNLTADQVEETIRGALGLPVGDRTYARPPVVHGPVHDDKDLPVILGTEIPRYRAYNVLVLCPTDHHLVIYRGRLDMISGKVGKTEFREVYPRDVTLMSVVDSAPDVTFHARNTDGTEFGTRVDKVKLRELTIGSGKDEDKFSVLLTPGAELDTFLTALRGLLKEHKTADTAVRIVRSVPLPVHIEAPLPVPVRIDAPLPVPVSVAP
jgi:hypothetical protein